jgi:hypothetical protein
MRGGVRGPLRMGSPHPAPLRGATLSPKWGEGYTG